MANAKDLFSMMAHCTCTPEELAEVQWGAAVGAALKFGDCPRCLKPKWGDGSGPFVKLEPLVDEMRENADNMALTLQNLAVLRRIEQAVLAERERCLKIAQSVHDDSDTPWGNGYTSAARLIEAKIQGVE